MKLPNIDFKYIVIIVLAMIIFASYNIISIQQGHWWDEAVYLSMGKAIQQGRYSLDANNPVESFRAPVFSYLLSPFVGSVFAAKLFVLFTVILSLLGIYYAGKELFNKDVGLWSSLLVGTNYLFLFFANKVLTEPLLVALFSFSLFTLSKWSRTKQANYIIFTAILSGLMLMTRYLSILVIGVYILYIIVAMVKERDKKIAAHFLFFIAVFLVVLIPWFMISYKYYGSMAAAFNTNFSVYAVSDIQDFGVGLSFIASSLGFSLLFFFGLPFIFRERKNIGLLILFILVLTVGLFLTFKHKEARYLLTYLPVYSILAAVGITKLSTKLTRYRIGLIMEIVLLVLFVYTAYSGILNVKSDNSSTATLIDAFADLKSFTLPGETVLTPLYPYSQYFSQRKAITFCGEPSDIGNFQECHAKLLKGQGLPLDDIPRLLKEFNVKYILSYKYEPSDPQYIIDFLNSDPKFEKVKTYPMFGDHDVVVIYRFKG